MSENSKDDKKVKEAISELKHELASPLSVISGVCNQLENRDVTEARVKQVRKLLKNSYARMNDILENATEGVNSAKIEILDVNEIIVKTVDNFKYLLREEKITLDLKKHGNLSNLKLKVNPTHLYQVVFNLVKNSFNSLKKTDKDIKLIKLEFLKEDDNLKIIIEDNGVGFSREDAKRVFNERFTSSKDKESHGIGLGVVKKYVKEFEGSIELDRHFLDGAKFVMTIPLYLNESGRKILIVDDTEDVLDTLKLTLEDNNLVYVCTDVFSAIEILMTRDIDLIISDFKMPEKNGFEFYQDVREANPDIPFIIFSAYPCDETIEAASDDENLKFVNKPNIAELEDHIISSSTVKTKAS